MPMPRTLSRAEPFVTSFGVVGWLPPAWLDPGRSLVLLSGSLSTLPMSPPYGGNAVTIPVPFGLVGLSVLAQSVAWDPGIGLIWSDGVELTL